MRTKFRSSNNLRRRRKKQSLQKKTKSAVVFTSEMKQELEKKIDRDIQQSLWTLVRSYHFKIFRLASVGFFFMTFISYKLLGRQLIADFFSGKLAENRTDYKTTPEEDKVYFILSMLLIGFISVTNILLMQVIKAEKTRRFRQANATKMSADGVPKVESTATPKTPSKTNELSGQNNFNVAQIAIDPTQSLERVVCDEQHAEKKQATLTSASKVSAVKEQALNTNLSHFFDEVLSCCHLFHEELKKEVSPQAIRSSQKSWKRLLQLKTQRRKQNTKQECVDAEDTYLRRILDFEQRLSGWFKKVKKTGLYAQSNSGAMELERKKQFFIKLNRLADKTMETVVDLRVANSLARARVLARLTRKMTVFKCGLAPLFSSFREHWDQMSQMMGVSSSEESDGQVPSEGVLHVRRVAASVKKQDREGVGSDQTSVSVLSTAANTVAVRHHQQQPDTAPGAPTARGLFSSLKDRRAQAKRKSNSEFVAVSDKGAHRKDGVEPFSSVPLCQSKGREPPLGRINDGQYHQKAILMASQSMRSDQVVDGVRSDNKEENKTAVAQSEGDCVVCTGKQTSDDRMPEESTKRTERLAEALLVTTAEQKLKSTGRSDIPVRRLPTAINCSGRQVGVAQGENVNDDDRQARAFHSKSNTVVDTNEMDLNKTKQQNALIGAGFKQLPLDDNVRHVIKAMTPSGRVAVSCGMESWPPRLLLAPEGQQTARYVERASPECVRWSAQSDAVLPPYHIVTHPEEMPFDFEPALSWHPVSGVDAKQARDKFKVLLVTVVDALQKTYQGVYLKGLQCSFLRSTFRDIDLHVCCGGSGWGGVDRILNTVHQYNGVILSDCRGGDYRSVSIEYLAYELDLTFSTATLNQALQKSNTFVTASGMRPLSVDAGRGCVIAEAMQWAVPVGVDQNAFFKRWDQARRARRCEVQKEFKQSIQKMLAEYKYNKGNLQQLMKLKKGFCFVLKMAVRHDRVSSQCMTLLMLLSRAISFSRLVDAYCVNYLGCYQSDLMRFLVQQEKSVESNVKLWASIVKEHWFGFLKEQGLEPSNSCFQGHRFFSIQSPPVASTEVLSSSAVPE